ncbi:glyoxalase [Parafrankia colletiae]|uniref:Glyoxalase n=1 Tax=Parafrankia colletiae TaxID=573497 RepID=A0A1S1QXK4_9ACTN|nr:VOC family protein [Parafrankia colletiae]MCK9898623.1 VOC family protein [Frankia sp. Cpl3]OHV39418.1 glyoxalase [Parafrankia colletiae]
MPAHETTLTGAPCWVDLMTADVDGARRFYSELFGWTAQESDSEFGGYFNFTRNGRPVAGGMPKQQPELPDVWSVYLLTQDAEKTVAAVPEHGGSVMIPPMAVADLGTMAVVTDPAGAVIGMWQPGAHRGFELLAEPGAPGWFELMTRDFGSSVPFYQEVFGWHTKIMGDSDEFRYTVQVDDSGDEHAGIMDASAFLPEGVPSHWGVYFAVEDTDATLALTERLGGATVQPATDTPYGRLAVATDPTGAVFKLLGPNKEEQKAPAKG